MNHTPEDRKHYHDVLDAMLDGRKVKHPNDWIWSGIHLRYPASDYIIAPATRIINGFEVPEPLREAPEHKTLIWISTANWTSFCYMDTWSGVQSERTHLERGLIHLTQAAAVANAKAMCGIDPEWKA